MGALSFFAPKTYFPKNPALSNIFYSIMATLIEVIHSKLGLGDEVKVKNKTTELMRLLELRSTNIPAQINEYGKIVLCTDIAAGLLSIDFDKEQALKLSGLRKSPYANYKRLFEKLLDINRLVGTKEICIQLGLNGVNQKADELLNLYGKTVASEEPDIDINHPQYAAMAVFQACKLIKQKIIKPKVMSFSNLRPTQWTLLEQRWDKFITQHYNKLQKLKLSSEVELNSCHESARPEIPLTKRQKAIEIEDYDHWKRRMLTLAETKLKAMNEKMEKENTYD